MESKEERRKRVIHVSSISLILCRSIFVTVILNFVNSFLFFLKLQVFKPSPILRANFIIVLAIFSICNIIELVCYLVLFHYIYHHNKSIGAIVLRPELIHQRNRKNAITMVGQFCSWILELSYFFLLIFFATRLYHDQRREIASIIKLSEFSFIPLVQIITTSSMTQFVFGHNKVQ